MFQKLDDHTYRAIGLTQFKWLDHWFGTRSAPEPSERRDVITLRQIHSARCYVARPWEGLPPQGDALICGVNGQLVGVKTADCVPILLVDPRRRAVAAVHAGWRGVLLEVASEAVTLLHKTFGTRAADLHVAIGPAIGFCCYEVGEEVAGQFQRLFPERRDLWGTARLDLPEANRRQLLELGVPQTHIHTASLCTRCNPAEFHSYRRDGSQAGRMLSAVGVK